MSRPSADSYFPIAVPAVQLEARVDEEEVEQKERGSETQPLTQDVSSADAENSGGLAGDPVNGWTGTCVS